MPAPTTLTLQQKALTPLLEKHLVRPWPDFGTAVGVGSASAAHRALKTLEAAGRITVVRTGHRLLVPTADILQLLGLTHAEAARIVYGPGGTPEGAEDPRDDEADDTVDGAL